MNNEYAAILSLLDDPDEEVYKQVYDFLINKGSPVISNLEEFWTESNNSFVQNRVEHIIGDINFNVVFKEFNNCLKNKPINLLECAVVISRLQYPTADILFVNQYVDDLAKKIKCHFNKVQSEYDLVQ
jgi:hypothetical protein